MRDQDARTLKPSRRHITCQIALIGLTLGGAPAWGQDAPGPSAPPPEAGVAQPGQTAPDDPSQAPDGEDSADHTDPAREPGASGRPSGVREAVLWQALTRFDGGETEAAIEAVLSALARHPADTHTAVAFARALGERGAFDEAITFLEQHLSRRAAAGGDDPNAALEMGTLLLTLLRFEEAADYFSRVPPGEGTAGELARLNLGKAYRGLGRFEEAREIYAALLDGRSGLFAHAALCEVVLALDGPEAVSPCLREARERHGGHPALAQPTILLAYWEGDMEQAEERIRRLYAQGRPGGRIMALRALVALAQSGPEAALEAIEQMEEVTVLGERDALTAVALARAERLAEAAERYRDAVGRNPLFEDPAAAGRVLFWRPEVIAALTAAQAEAQAGDAEVAGAAEGTGTPAPAGSGPEAPPGEATPTRTGCCRAVSSGGGEASPAALLWLAAAALWLGWRRRSGPTASP